MAFDITGLQEMDMGAILDYDSQTDFNLKDIKICDVFNAKLELDMAISNGYTYMCNNIKTKIGNMVSKVKGWFNLGEKMVK